MPIQETFHGFIETTTDALLVFEACRRGILPKVSRRLQERERGSVRSGTVFVFDEKESGIKRWTDGIVWSPSRILGNFLVYRELDGRESIQQQQPYDDEEYMTMEDRNRERALVGSLTDTYRFRKDGLIKKTLSIHLNNSFQHLISYYTKQDVLDKCLVTPSSIPDIGAIRLSPDLLLRQSFRVPPSVEYNDSSLSPTSSSSSCCSTPPSSVTKKKNLDEVNNVPSAIRRRGIESTDGYDNNPLSRKIARLSMDFNNHKSTFIESPPPLPKDVSEDNISAFKIVKQFNNNSNMSFLGTTRKDFNPLIADIRHESTSWSPLERKYSVCNKLIPTYDPCVDQHHTNYHPFQNNHHFH